MEDEGIFKSSMFGFEKQAVLKYVDDMIEKNKEIEDGFKRRTGELSVQCGAAREQLERANARVRELEDALRGYDGKLGTLDRTISERNERERALVERLSAAERELAEKQADSENASAEKISAVEQSAAERIAAVEKSAAEQILAVKRSAAERILDLERSSAEKIEDLEQSSAERVSAMEKDFIERITAAETAALSYKKQLEEISEKGRKYDQFTSQVGDVIVEAQNQGDVIIAKANKRAEKIAQSSVESIYELNKRVDVFKNDIQRLRSITSETLRTFDGKINEIDLALKRAEGCLYINAGTATEDLETAKGLGKLSAASARPPQAAESAGQVSATATQASPKVSADTSNPEAPSQKSAESAQGTSSVADAVAAEHSSAETEKTAKTAAPKDAPDFFGAPYQS